MGATAADTRATPTDGIPVAARALPPSSHSHNHNHRHSDKVGGMSRQGARSHDTIHTCLAASSIGTLGSSESHLTRSLDAMRLSENTSGKRRADKARH